MQLENASEEGADVVVNNVLADRRKVCVVQGEELREWVEHGCHGCVSRQQNRGEVIRPDARKQQPHENPPANHTATSNNKQTTRRWHLVRNCIGGCPEETFPWYVACAGTGSVEGSNLNSTIRLTSHMSNGMLNEVLGP
jgi:hypothetical protein